MNTKKKSFDKIKSGDHTKNTSQYRWTSGKIHTFESSWHAYVNYTKVQSRAIVQIQWQLLSQTPSPMKERERLIQLCTFSRALGSEDTRV